MSDYNEANPFDDLPKQIKAYLNSKVDLISLLTIKKIGQLIPPMVMGFLIAFTLLFFTFFISYSFIQWYTDYVGKSSTASLIVSGFYLLLSLFIYIFRKSLIYNPIQKNIISEFKFKNINKESEIGEIENFSDLNKEIDRISKQSDDNEECLNDNIDEIKEYYSFDAIKTRFIDEIFQNPKPAISIILQSILTISSFRKKIKKRKLK